MTSFRVLVTDQVFPDVDLERQLIEEAGGKLEVSHGSRQETLDAARDADALLNTYMPFDAAALADLSRCKIIARYGIGVDNIDLAAARAAGIAVTNVPDYCVEEVAAHAVALILALVRRLPQGDEIVRGGGWGIGDLVPLRRMSTLTVGLLGYGRIGHRVAMFAQAAGCPVLVSDPYLKPESVPYRLVSADALFAEADIVSVHCPLTPGTRHLVNADQLGRMKRGSYLVNTSRGPVVEVGAVYDALRAGQLAGAGLDVFDPEPPDVKDLATVPNLIATPHSAFYSVEAVKESQRKAATQVLKAIRGEPLDYPVG
jgi:D-3-phosphoglycerate dehydrogenase / 2-oxoglutarate reductase